ncbi:restriction endonuclease subunit S [Flavobacterium sp. LB2P6]|uniref:restriction endonuclease subunit S n=1 Tax=Flavobacterium sp. LB2P6 TaxID=3401714 RepID=UPI003AAB550F
MQKVKFKELFSFEKKSKIKAGDGFKLGEGKYPFYTSSDTLSKTLNEFLFEDESLIFGTGGLASIHHCDEKFAVSTDCFVTQPNNKKEIFAKYVYYYLSGNMHLLENGFKGAGLKHISKGYIEDLEIPLPPLATQQKIAIILDKADELRQYNKQLIEKYDALTQSLFLEMFGDPVKNEKEWEIKELHLVALISSGITKGRKNNILDSIGEIPYMRVANVQDGYLDLTEIKTIPAFKTDLEKFLLKKGDVLMTEGGDPDKLGRGAVWQNEIEQCLHQNHIFKVRVDSNLLTPLYFNKLASSLYGKKYFLKIAKQTTGIATINKTQLSKFPVLMASIDLQNQFAERVELIEIQKQQAQEALVKSEELFQSLLQKAFKEELV